jgi:thiol-disulfide isomerase/thioredoxin
MKKYLFILIVILKSISVPAQPANGFLVKGELANAGDGKLVFYYRNPTKTDEIKRDSTTFHNGLFEFRGAIPNNEAVVMVFQIMKDGLPPQQPPGRFFVQNGDQIQLKVDGKNLQAVLATGNKYNDQFNELKTLIKEDQQAINYAVAQMQNNQSSGGDEKQQQIRGMMKTMQDKEQVFAKAHPDYLVSSMLVALELQMTPEEKASAYNSFTKEVKQGMYGRIISEQLAEEKVTGVGASAIEFAKKDPQGNTIRLADYKGKYVLLDFWGSWCGPCRAGNPHLKELYEYYKGKGLDIIGVANERGETLADNKSTWMKAVKEDGLPWKQVLNNEGIEKYDVTKLYNVNAFPTKILLDKDGEIIGRFTGTTTGGEKDGLTEKLKEIFGN